MKSFQSVVQVHTKLKKKAADAGRRSTLSRRRVPGVLPDGSMLPKAGPAIPLPTSFTKSKLSLIDHDNSLLKKLQEKNTAYSAAAVGEGNASSLGALTKLTPRQKELTPRQKAVSSDENTTVVQTNQEGGDNDPSTDTETVKFSTRRQQSPRPEKLIKVQPRSLGSIFKEQMQGLLHGLKKVNKSAQKVEKYRSDLAVLDEPITSCSTSKQLAIFSEQAQRRHSMCRRRSSGFGSSASCGDGRTSFLFTQQGPLPIPVGGRNVSNKTF